jgi:hypothetical protein
MPAVCFVADSGVPHAPENSRQASASKWSFVEEQMRITDVMFAASLDCPTKCLLYLHHEAGGNSEFSQWQARSQADFETLALDRMCSTLPVRDIFLGTPPLPNLRTCRYRLVVGYEAVTPDIQSRLHALQLVAGKPGRREEYVPIRLVFRE